MLILQRTLMVSPGGMVEGLQIVIHWVDAQCLVSGAEYKNSILQEFNFKTLIT
jgi:hypothetical protein